MARGFSPTMVPKEIRLQKYSRQSVYESLPPATEAAKISPNHREKLLQATNNCTNSDISDAPIWPMIKADSRIYWLLIFEL